MRAHVEVETETFLTFARLCSIMHAKRICECGIHCNDGLISEALQATAADREKQPDRSRFSGSCLAH